MHAGRLQSPQKLSVGALSQQWPFLLIDERTPQPLSESWNSALQYRLPRSLWNITPGGGLRRRHVMASASLTRPRLRVLLQAPTHHLAAEQVNDSG